MSLNPDEKAASANAARAKARKGSRSAPSDIVKRLQQVVGDVTFADLARATSCNSETVRRYMRGGTPSVEFVIGVGRHYGVSLDWLLLGDGPQRRAGGNETANGVAHNGVIASDVQAPDDPVDVVVRVPRSDGVQKGA